MYFKNCKTLMKETEDVTNRWKNILSSWLGKINTVKMTILPKVPKVIQCSVGDFSRFFCTLIFREHRQNA